MSKVSVLPYFEYELPEFTGNCPVCKSAVDPGHKFTRGAFCSPACKNQHKHHYMCWIGEHIVRPGLLIKENAKKLKGLVSMKKPRIEISLKELLKLGFDPEIYLCNLAPDHVRPLLEIEKYYVEMWPSGRCVIRYIPYESKEIQKNLGHLIQMPFTQA